MKFGRPFFLRYGKYFFISPESIQKADDFFSKHGHISTLVGRLLPVIRQYISLPAGIARMSLKTFTLFTTIGAGSWVCVLTFAGYLLGEHQDLLKEYLHVITLSCIAVAVVIGGAYYIILRRRKKQ